MWRPKDIACSRRFSKWRRTANAAEFFPDLPEYFNNEGQGRYMYLTGSASWYVLTLLTQVFGVRGLGAAICWIAPKLEPDQYDKNKALPRSSVRFAGAHVTVRLSQRASPCRVRKNIKSRLFVATALDVPFRRVSDKRVVIVARGCWPKNRTGSWT